MNKREIKFRAWDKEHKEMYEVFNIFFNVGLSKYVAVIGNNTQCEERDEENCIILQYTGLKDRNVKEIYEGDFIKPGRKGFPCQEECLPVYWSKEHLAYGIFYGDHEFEYLVDWVDGCEIVGNVFQNQELLNPPNNN